MRKNRMIAAVLICVIGTSVLAGCTMADFDPTKFMAQQTKEEESQSGDQYATQNPSGENNAGDKNNGAAESNQNQTGADGSIIEESKSLPSITIMKMGEFNEDVLATAGISEFVNLSVADQTSGSSFESSAKGMLAFAKEISSVLDSAESDGIVIINDASVIEEMAFLLELTISSSKPVVMLSTEAAMKIAANQKSNLYNGILVAASEASQERGIMETHDGMIYKLDSKRTEIGTISDDQLVYTAEPDEKNTEKDKFDISGRKTLPDVGIVYEAWGSDTMLLEAAFDLYDGIVIAGNGMLSEEIQEFLQNSRKRPIVVRTANEEAGNAVRNQGISDDECGTIAAGTLSAEQARILLMLSLAAKKNVDDIQEKFNQF